MTLKPGSRLGTYEVLEPLGAGGMGEVYRARDTKLDRDVAIKVLPARVAGDADALARFEREAKAVAALSHPNILAVYDFGTHQGAAYAVMEYLEGETLRDRLLEGKIPARRAIEYAGRIARGLGAAHDKGIVHRDLKPENLFLTSDGQVKILDFGLARSETSPGNNDTPTRTSLTSPGAVLGTAGYMSPEQVRGRPTDARSDIFAFGAVLYEMLTGQRAFTGESAVETMNAILKEEPADLFAQVPDLTPSLERIVRHCIEKNPAERFQSARDLAFALEAATGTSSASAGHVALDADPARARPRAGRILGAIGLLVVGLVGGALLQGWLRPPAPSRAVKISPATFSGRDRAPAASPDGRLIAFVSARDGRNRVWLKDLATGGEVPLTEGADDRPRFSPDGSSLLFVRTDERERSLFRVGVVGGQPRKIVADAEEGDWSPDGNRIVFVRVEGDDAGVKRSIFLANANGSAERRIASIGDRNVQYPRWSPGGRQIAVTLNSMTNNVASSLALVDAESGSVRILELPGDPSLISGSAWTADGHGLVFARSESILGGTSSPASRVVYHDVDTGETRDLFWAQNLFVGVGSGGGTLDIVADGVVVLDSFGVIQNLREIRLENGTASHDHRTLTRGSARDRQPVFSPDGGTILFSSNRSGNLDIWSLSVDNGEVRRVTDDAADDWDPAFTPDGASIVWSSNRSGNLEIWMADADGSGARQVTRDGVDAENPTMTRDGAWIVYVSANSRNAGIWKIRPDGTEATRLVDGLLFLPETSPDGRRFAYVAQDRDSRTNQVRVADVETGGPLPFEANLSFHVALPWIGNLGRPRWMPDGRALVYLGQDREGRTGLYIQGVGPDREAGATRRVLAGFDPEVLTESFGIAPDGSRVIVSTQEEIYSLNLATGVDGVQRARK